ncbi:tRNA lysidine(34) synthetase TilS [Chloracidobacterium thermophilum]|jgi:tRNA(Ile)-lysidine synthase|uniref:tRNA(Ile)-lysidine synthase n=1 Tax=Chloracidobacterium thermophilum (strain B) TaxID=981222 RepID=G2LJ49_CHLTF|nr:tRNA lysidine(34) synthetase TilS [Chloracidobacterium thermophilum]AEP12336.1 tRNA(Ile)-lysidine synthetase, N-terminal domain protein [Chloracidobacterium thermophilum B]QUV78083.1 tRNA lysidine(34) synthetase TilS [Chloracidobacterium thermophilum]
MKFTAESILNVAWLRQVAGFPSAGVVVAVSGGLDSMTLLHALHTWCGDCRAQCLHVAHLNHGLRGEASTADAQLVAETAAQMGLDWTVERADIAQSVASGGGNLEAVARQVRYAFLRRTAERLGAAFVATAHTQSDQAETVLLRLVRGTSLAGLTAIAPLRPLAAGTPVQVIRPLLTVSRRQIVAYARYHGVRFREDVTNHDLSRARNRLRHRVLPELEQLNPQVGSALARLAAQAREDQQYLMTLAQSWLKQHARRAGGRLALPVSELLVLPPPIRRRVLHAVAQQAEYPAVASRHITAIEQTLLPGDAIGKCVDLTGGRQVRRIADALVFTEA